jgi:hypothetical protein
VDGHNETDVTYFRPLYRQAAVALNHIQSLLGETMSRKRLLKVKPKRLFFFNSHSKSGAKHI